MDRKQMKRRTMPRSWPLPSKIITFVVKPRAGKGKERSIPLVVLLRDLLKEVKTFKEGKKVIRAGWIEVNGKIVREERFPIALFDRVSIEKLKKYFTITLNQLGKIQIKEISEKQYLLKPTKVIGKKPLKKNKLQINLLDGFNLILNKEKVKVGDTVIINLKNKKIEKILSLKKDAKVYLIKGKNVGKIATVLDVNKKIVEIELEKEKKKMSYENLIVIDENEIK